MSIRINDRCIGCGRCADVCPGSLIDVIGKKAVMQYPEGCWGCVSCVKECPVRAIEFFLGEDIGGGSAYMQVEREGKLLNWKFYDSDHREKPIRTITVDSTDSNKY
ncbi:4Fe-4S dicluster domain-containing protein [Bilifractor sp. LCP21S3_A7]|jgi:adenylylsulfate reductase subunit B|uniref:4Fe-4S dicluster domain-containing protein n=1 Tax=Bilifractor sp. LCP21S3_A7 TaxID=3438738 RepID=UPI003F93685E